LTGDILLFVLLDPVHLRPAHYGEWLCCSAARKRSFLVRWSSRVGRQYNQFHSSRRQLN
jgi:hypothetical protein